MAKVTAPAATAVQLKAISIRIQVRVNRVAEECIAIGRDYLEAKDLLKKNGKLFVSSGRVLGAKILEQLATAKDEVREALLEHIETKQSQGETVTIKEILPGGQTVA